jgi:hypothetical protein
VIYGGRRRGSGPGVPRPPRVTLFRPQENGTGHHLRSQSLHIDPYFNPFRMILINSIDSCEADADDEDHLLSVVFEVHPY